jgi:hypothetical protein
MKITQEECSAIDAFGKVIDNRNNYVASKGL